ncbi:MAG: hypothetical protein VW239_03380 [Candidatus Nanopelagicales bacterium]
MEAIVTSVVGALASNVVGGLMNKKDKAPAAPAPTVEPPTLMPDPLAEKAAQRRKAAVSLSRQLNAADTILTGGDNKLGA